MITQQDEITGGGSITEAYSEEHIPDSLMASFHSRVESARTTDQSKTPHFAATDTNIHSRRASRDENEVDGEYGMWDMLDKVEEELNVPSGALKHGLSHPRPSPDGLREVYTKLSLPAMGLTSVEPLRRFHFLQRVELPDNGLTDVSALSIMRFMVQLDVSGNRLTKTPDFNPAPYNLQEIDMSRNQIMAIGDMDAHRFLKRVCLDRNLIKKISGFEGCKYLTHLSLRNNGITKIENLDHLPLKVLDLRQNRLRNVENIDLLPELEELLLAHNYISSLQGFENHPSLNTIDLDNNDLSNFDDVQYLQSLPMLRHLSIRKNPIETHHNYRIRLIYHLQNLTTLSGFPVSPEEKTSSINLFSPPSWVTNALHRTNKVKSEVRQYAKIQANDLAAMSSRFRPIVLAGPAGSGKRTLTGRLLSEFPHVFGLAVSHTTRKPRHGEENGVHYHFVTRQDMQHMMDQGHFVEVVSMFGNWYGTSLDAMNKVKLEGKICIMDLELEGVLALKRTQFDARYIYITTPSFEVLQERLEKRILEQHKAMMEAREVEKQRQKAQRHGLSGPNDITASSRTFQLADSQASLGTSSASLLNSSSMSGFESSMTNMSASASRTSHRARLPSDSPVLKRASSTASSNGSEGLEPDREAQMLVTQWLEKAHRDTKPVAVGPDSENENSRQEALFAEYMNEPGFFDAVVVNDDLDKAYESLRSIVMRYFWDTYEDEDNE